MPTKTEMPNANAHVLLLHGAGLGRWIWDMVIPELHAPAEAIDLPGRGDQSAPGDVTLQQCIDKEYCSDLDEKTTRLVLENITPEAPRLYLDRLDWSALPERLPRFYVKLLNDKSVAPRQQDQIIDRIGATNVESLQTGHLPMLARPHALATTLNRFLDAVY